MKPFLPLLALFALTMSSHARPKTYEAAVSILGQPDFVSAIDSDPPTSRSLYQTEGVAIDPTSGKLFVGDNGNHRILRFSSIAAYQTFAEAEAVFGQPDLKSNKPNRDGPPSALTLDSPATLCFDSDGNLWVADKGNARVLRYDSASTKPAFGAAADGVIGQPDFVSNTAAVNSTADSGFISPAGVAIDSAGNLFVSDGSGIPRVLRFANAVNVSGDVVASSYLGVINGANEFISGTPDGALSYPYGICVDSADRLWVADSSNHRVLRFDNPTVTGSIADGVLGQPDINSNSIATPPTARSMDFPSYVTVAPDGTLWVSDYANYRVLGFVGAANKIDGAPADIVLGQTSFTTDIQHPYSAFAVVNPSQIAIGREGSLFIGEFSFGAHLKRWSDPVVINAPKSVTAKGSSAKIKGTASGVTSVGFLVAGQAGLQPTTGTATNWSLKAKRLKKRRTKVTVQGTAFDGRIGTDKVTVTKE